jgi:hypothetical protein
MINGFSRMGTDKKRVSIATNLTPLGTNGTWLFAGEEERIIDGMIFKAGHSLFRVEIPEMHGVA